ncbi:MAG TPA: sigma factor-like helix-turn-helix DNA-binding protein [Pseudonocardiaceae bacterium]|jgi:hypothetical protein|nr:sigma factor-like helix-turn-helix DNA-binding protein [Pseudonocardiaceae bacterium]
MPGGVEPWRTPIYTNAGFAEEQRVCYTLRLAGHTIRQIADQTGLSKSTVARRLECEIRETVDPLRDEYKRVVHDRYEALWKRTVQIIETPHPVVSDGRVVREVVGEEPAELDDGGKNPRAGKPIYGEPLIDHGATLTAIARGESILGRLMDLHGLKAAVKVDATVTESPGEFGLEVIELINTAKAQDAANASRLGDEPNRTSP